MLAYNFPLCLDSGSHFHPIPMGLHFSLLCRRDWSFFLYFPSEPACAASSSARVSPKACPGSSCPTLHVQLLTSSLGCAGTLCRGQSDKGTAAFRAFPALLFVAFPASRGDAAVCSYSCAPWLVLASPPVSGAAAGPCLSCHPPSGAPLVQPWLS